MTTANKALPPHGTAYRYKGPRTQSWLPCRCTACVRAHNHACTLRALAHLNGRPPLYPRAPLAEHIACLHSAGMSYGLISRQAQVSPSTISYLARGLTQSCRRDKALRILAVRPGNFDEKAERPALGSRRRIQALYAIGHSPATIAAAAGLSASTISHFANHRYETTDGATAEAVRSAYRQLAWRQGSSRKAKARATALAWHSPLAWGGSIDDPDCHPEREQRREGGPGRPERIDAQRVARLTAEGLTAAQIAAELRCHKRTVVRARSRVAPEMAVAA